ncbi:uncharacterized protein LOC129293618 [Prosopis cineraria]|uniref:uncharacterized protein LOC129293618 n=1 Tax=Prosopis cineraria TaxID=364024 RepID=UPI00240EE0AC|nr:uncharacterized protein LOC129293618 [Prosopis cineraria]
MPSTCSKDSPTTAHHPTAGACSPSAFRWFDFDFSLRSSPMRWTGMFGSYISPPRRPASGSGFRWRLTDWSNLLSLSIVDDFIWGLVTAFESVCIVSTLCFFFLFCGCTV